MASGSTYRKGKSWYYIADVGTHPDGRRRQKRKGGFPTRSDAQDALRDLLSTLSTSPELETTQTLAAYLEESWLPAKRLELRDRTWEDYAWALRRYVVPHLGTRRLSKLKVPILQAFYSELAARGGKNGKPLAAGTVAYVHRVLKSALNDAVRWEMLDRNPLAGVRPPKPVASRETARGTEAWTEEELDRFLSAAQEDRLFPLWRLLAYTGLRRGEALGLRWEDVDLDPSGGTVTVKWSLTYAHGRTRLTAPKTAASLRQVAIDPRTALVLRAWRKVQLSERLLWGMGWEDSGFVFTREDGRALLPPKVSERFKALASDHGLPVIRLHALRHTHATILLQRGVHPKLVQERLGHSSITETMDTYSHATPAMHREAIEALPQE